MYPYSHLPHPLSTSEFYIMLSLAGEPMHVYAIKGKIHQHSLGSVKIGDGQLYKLVSKLHNEGYIDLVAKGPAGPSQQERLIYSISEYGTIRLAEEIQRLTHAVKVAQAFDITKPEIPADIQRLLLDVRSAKV